MGDFVALLEVLNAWTPVDGHDRLNWKLDSSGKFTTKSTYTHDKLQRKFANTMLGPSMCCLCLKAEESLDHFFLHRDFAKKGWNLLFRPFGLGCCLPNKVDDWLPDGLDCNAFGDKGKILWRCATRSLLWCLWKERNSRVFEDKYASFDSFWIVVQTHNLMMVLVH